MPPILLRLSRNYPLRLYPERMRTDNGDPFGSNGESGLTGLYKPYSRKAASNTGLLWA